MGQVEDTYKHSSKDFVFQWELLNTKGSRESVHDVQKYQKTRYFHGDPSYFSGDVEDAVVGCLAGGI